MTIPRRRRKLPGVTVAAVLAIVVVVGSWAWVNGGHREVRDIVETVKVPDQTSEKAPQ
ncbi:hypothetical protein [Sphingomonas sp. IC081]|uniref:hypothetical protein n=1 Tax=Sphingomonas sp. IC081 TaxID=304378 RepID=UPI00163C077C|nr:hypothetical protein [Sphingomonas sp. IC081]